MAINQKSWSIWLRPKIDFKNNVQVFLNNDDKIEIKHPIQNPDNECTEYADISTIEDIDRPEKEGGAWTEEFHTTSYEQLRVEYKKLLKRIPRKQILVTENIPLDILVIPEE